MIVTVIEEISKSKVRVTIDHEISFQLYKGELRTYGLREQEEVTEMVYVQLMTALEKRAKLRCMNLLKSRDYTNYQLRKKLHDNGYPDNIIERAISYVSSYGYVDDERYTRNYIESLSRSKSRKQIENDLLRKGVEKTLITRIFAVMSEEQEEDAEEELIRRYLTKKRYEPDTATYEERCKIIAFLYRKGFLLDKIYKVVGEIE